MKSLQDYIDVYNSISSNLGLSGDSVEMLVQMLANASYISEVENVSYAQEASLEKATLMNSKIQHCVDEMYSVYRGSCPRVILTFKPTKYFTFNLFDEIISSNSFKIYYLGYFNKEGTAGSVVGSSVVSEDVPEFTYAPITIAPSFTDDTSYTIIGLLAKVNETVSKSWTLDQSNTYYVDCLEENLSNDMWVKINSNYFDVTRDFSTHILESKIFDLTLPSLGSRLYVADILKSTVSSDIINTPTNTYIEAFYYKNSDLDTYNVSELSKINLKGALFVTPPEELNLDNLNFRNLATGVYYVEGTSADTIPTIHYKAVRDRYVSTILRSNSDVGTVLENTYPEKVKLGGTSYTFSTDDVTGINTVNIFYVPKVNSNLLTDDEILNFINTRTAYYITDNITVAKGEAYTVTVNLDVEIFQNSSITSEVSDILEEYSSKFNINLESSREEIKAFISKISNVRQILNMSLIYFNESGKVLSQEEIDNINSVISYFQIEYTINSVIQSKSIS